MAIERLGIYNWGLHQTSLDKPVRTPRLPVQIDDETWRDGMQGTQSHHHPSIKQKDNYIKTAVEYGYIDHLDIGFPASSPNHRIEIISLIRSAFEREIKPTFSVAGRGAAIDDGRAILEVAQKTGAHLRADLFLDASNIRASIEGWDRGEKLKQTMKNIALLKKEGLLVMFVPERSSATPPEELFEACKLAAEEGVDRIAITDTTGILDPTGTQKLFREVFENIGKRYPGIKFDFHGHNDLGMGTANCVIAAYEGIDCLHATARGVGERAGNVKLEELLVVLDIKGLRKIDGTHIQDFVKMAADILAVPIDPHEPIVGEESTETASGVHASTYEKMENGESLPIYFPFNPKDYALKPKVKVGPFSGLSNVRAYCASLGIHEITEEKAAEVLAAAKGGLELLSEEVVRKIVGRNGKFTEE